MNTIEIHNIIDLEYQEWIDVGFGKMIFGIFVRGDDKVFTIDEQKESFFYLLKKLLDDNKIVFFPPEPNSKIKKYKYCSNGEYYVEATISPVSCSTQPISGQVSYQKSVNLMSFSLVISLGNMSLI
jgi:hypothetical protein